MKNFKNSLSRNEMKTIFAGGGKAPAPIASYCNYSSSCSGHGGCSNSSDGVQYYCSSCCVA